MGFMDDILRIVSQLPKKRQTIMFSATMPPKIRQFAKQLQEDPKEVTIAISKPAEGISQKAFMAYEDQKLPLLEFFLKSGYFDYVIVFASTKLKVGQLYKSAKKMNLAVEAFHSGLDQSEREDILRAFKARKVKILIGTDILSGRLSDVCRQDRLTSCRNSGLRIFFD